MTQIDYGNGTVVVRDYDAADLRTPIRYRDSGGQMLAAETTIDYWPPSALFGQEHQVKQVTGPNGVVTSFDYDGFGRPTLESENPPPAAPAGALITIPSRRREKGKGKGVRREKGSGYFVWVLTD